MDPPSTHLSLLNAMVDGTDESQTAWSTFVARYEKLIISWCRARGVSTRYVDDLSQEIMLKVFRSLPTYNPLKGRFRTWLSTVICTAIASYFRELNRHPGADGKGGDNDFAAIVNLQQPEAFEDLAQQVEQYVDPRLVAALEQVKQRTQPQTFAIFQQTALQGRAVADVARELGVGITAAHQAKRRVLTMLRDELRSYE